MRIALVKDDTIENIAEFDNFFNAQSIAVGLNLFPISVDDLPVNIGDTYKDGQFFCDGELVIPADFST